MIGIVKIYDLPRLHLQCCANGWRCEVSFCARLSNVRPRRNHRVVRTAARRWSGGAMIALGLPPSAPLVVSMRTFFIPFIVLRNGMGQLFIAHLCAKRALYCIFVMLVLHVHPQPAMTQAHPQELLHLRIPRLIFPRPRYQRWNAMERCAAMRMPR